ncbi:MAG: fluoride efflux transporter CrcB [Chthoniobacterales bacterium]
MLGYIWVMLGGAFGTGARFWVSGFVAQRMGEVFPLGTLVVNVSGSFLVGFFAALTDPQGPFLVSPSFRQFFMIGVFGGYTTFSSFSLQTFDLVRDGDWLKAGLNALLSFSCCVAAVWLGRTLVAAIVSK